MRRALPVGRQRGEDGRSAPATCWRPGGQGRGHPRKGSTVQTLRLGSAAQLPETKPGLLVRDLRHLTFLSSVFLISTKGTTTEPTPSCGVVMRSK